MQKSKKHSLVHLKKLKRLQHGKRFSTAQNQDTTLDMFLETVQTEDGPAYRAGFYDEYIAELRKSPPVFHQRFPVIQSDKKYKNTLDNISMEAMEMTNPDLHIYPAPTKMNCQGCNFRTPCLAKYHGENYVYTLDSLFNKGSRHERTA